MNASSYLRPSFLVACLCVALSASAQYRYSFSATSTGSLPPDNHSQSFTLVVPSPIVPTSTPTNFATGDGKLLGGIGTYMDAGGETQSYAIASLSLFTTPVTPGYDLLTVTGTGGSFTYGFLSGQIGAVGTYKGTGLPATLTVQAVPEPGTWAALGLGSMALLRRRKRA